jgi:hypothetical protein
LAAAQTAGATALSAMVYTALLPQLELAGMNRGFATVEASRSTAQPEWTFGRFVAAGDGTVE